MAKNMSFCLRWGNSCGTPFDKNKFCDEHREWAYLREYLDDRPQQPWTVFSITNNFSNAKTIMNRNKKQEKSGKSKTLKLKPM
jgi:hypothetical protein